MDRNLTFGEWLRRQRRALDLTRAALAEQAGCSVSALRKFEADQLRPSRQLAERLAAALQIAPAERAAFADFARDKADADVNHLAIPTAHWQEQVPRTNLPMSSAGLIGRERELADLAALLRRPDTRLLTITGPGGVGKTRLALQVASDLTADFPNGVYFVDLAPIADSRLVATAIATTLGLHESGEQPILEQLKHHVRRKRMLLLLDNVEHLLDGVGMLSDLLQHAPGICILATSRERLNLRAEWVFELYGLQVPDNDQAEGLADAGAVALFLQSARRAQAEFTVSKENLRLVVRICQLVEGMPLGIELAATWVRILPIADIAHEIGRGLGILTTSLRDVHDRHRSMRAVFWHSWSLLSADEQGVLARLSVFRGGFSREAAEQVAGASLALLAALIDKSLLRRDASGRYAIHDLLRQYAAEQLEAAGETRATRERHLAWYLALAEMAEPELRGAQQQLWLGRLVAEYDNLRAALEWSSADVASQAQFLRLAGALAWFWGRRGYLGEGRAWLAAALATAEPSVPVPVRAKAHYAAGCIALFTMHLATAQAMLEESAALWRTLGSEGKPGLAFALGGLVCALHEQGQPQMALIVAAESIALFRAQREQWGLAEVLCQQAMAFSDVKDFSAAQAAIRESIVCWKALSDQSGLSWALHYAGLIAFRSADYAAAGALLTESLAIRRDLGDVHAIAAALLNLGRAAINQRDDAQAQLFFDESAALFRQIGKTGGLAEIGYYQALMAHLHDDQAQAQRLFEQTVLLGREAGAKWVRPAGLLGLAGLAVGRGEARQAARWCGAADAAIAAVSTYLGRVECDYYDRLVATAVGELGQQAFNAAWVAGHALTLDQAIAEALGDTPVIVTEGDPVADFSKSRYKSYTLMGAEKDRS